jgi:2-amino-4-hydroxy-6-hydroxymethyldihydropteridine diphosphokinase
MVLLETALEPADLLGQLLVIETGRGRDRATGVRWGPRTLDLDIVRYGDRVIAEPRLIVPHPELPQRDFWQRELAELEVLVPHG